jgi:hypothetical protein
MQTPRPDYFTYPGTGEPPARSLHDDAVPRRPWMRAIFASGIIGAFALGFAIALYG